jgi:hypothetical protein
MQAKSLYQHLLENAADVEFERVKDKVIARLRNYDSQSYTKLAQKLIRISELTEELNELKGEVKQESRDYVAALFGAEDAAHTRVVETVSFIFELTKDPKPTVTPQYKAILEALTEHLTPELVTVLEALKKSMVSVTQKAPALKVRPVDESADQHDQLLQSVDRWATSYDTKLDELRAQAGL